MKKTFFNIVFAVLCAIVGIIVYNQYQEVQYNKKLVTAMAHNPSQSAAPEVTLTKETLEDLITPASKLITAGYELEIVVIAA